jgi:hypothetical protein
MFSAISTGSPLFVVASLPSHPAQCGTRRLSSGRHGYGRATSSASTTCSRAVTALLSTPPALCLRSQYNLASSVLHPLHRAVPPAAFWCKDRGGTRPRAPGGGRRCVPRPGPRASSECGGAGREAGRPLPKRVLQLLIPTWSQDGPNGDEAHMPSASRVIFSLLRGAAQSLVARLQAVAHPADGLDATLAELLAQVADVDVDDVGSGIEVVSPNVAQ